MKKILATALAGLAIALAQPAYAEAIKIGFGLPQNSHLGDGAKAFGEELARLSNGTMTVELMPSFQGGNERAALESAQIGLIDMAIAAAAPLSNFVKAVEVLDLPYVFRDTEHARKVQDGPIGQELLELITKSGMVGLGWGEAGFRHMTNNKKVIDTPADAKGMKIRTMQSDTHIEAFQAMGALPTPMSWSEVIPALQTGTLDGQENALAIITSTRVYEAQKHISLTGHAFTNIAWVFSPARWESLSDEQKGWVRQAVAKGIEVERARVDSDDEKGLQILKDAGVTVTEVDRKAFAEAVESAYAGYEQRFGKELIDRIRNTN
ncbi:MAG: TRAP transporter substrate-binding protein DctP [Mesorhizobium sp.]